MASGFRMRNAQIVFVRIQTDLGIREIADSILNSGDAEAEVKPGASPKKSLLGSFDLKSMMGKKEPKKAKAPAR